MIEILAVSYNAQPGAADLRAVFGEDGGTFGRGPDNRLVLPDPARHVSRVQARIHYDGARYWLANVSDANPLFVNEEEIESGHERPIIPGDEIRVGLYLLRVQEASGPAYDYHPAASTASPVAAAAGAPAQGGASLDALLGPAVPAAANPFADILGGAAPAAAVEPGPVVSAPAAPVAAPKPATELMEELGRLASGGTAPASDPFADLMKPAAAPAIPASPPPSPAAPSSADPFADLLRASPAPASGSAHLTPAFTGGIPDDFDPFAAPSPKKATTGDPLRDLSGSGIDFSAVGATPAQSLVDFDPARKADPRDPLQGGTPSLMDPLATSDPMKLFSGEDKLAARVDVLGPNAMPMRNDLPEIGAHFAPPRAKVDPTLPEKVITSEATRSPISAAPAKIAPPLSVVAAAPSREISPAAEGRPLAATAPSPGPVPAAAAVASGSPPRAPSTAPRPVEAPHPDAAPAKPALAMPTPDGTSASVQRLVAAFLDGARAPNVGAQLTPELMHKLGDIVYQAVAGAMTMMAARQITKREIGAEVTMIVASGNNPLKFLPTPEAAMMQILGPKMPGFMPAADAMQDAFDDLRAHEVGVIAGTRAAFSEVLRRFDPKQLEERLGKGGLLDAVVPSARKARLWDLFEARFNEIYREAQDDFDSLFGQAFTQAYEEEVARHRGKQGRS